MKPTVSPRATRRVLADIDAVLRERTAAAVERTLRTASPGHGPFPPPEASRLAWELLADLRTTPVLTTCLDDCDREGLDPFEDCGAIEVANATPGMTDAYGHADYLAREVGSQRRLLQPWVVSPHLFDQST